MGKNCIPSARPQEVIQFEQVVFEQDESCEAEWCIQEHAAQRKVVAVDEQQKLVKKSQEIQVEEKHVAEMKNKVRTVKNSLEVTNSSIKQTQNHTYAENTKSSESKRT